MPAPKAPKVLRAVVHVHGERDSGEMFSLNYNHATVSLYTSLDRNVCSWLEFTFQRHSLSDNTAPRHTPQYSGPRFNYQFDFGHQPWSGFYAGQLTTSFHLPHPEHMERAAKFVRKVNAAIREYNLDRVDECELTQYINALEKLKVEVTVTLGMRGMADIHVHELPEDQRHPAAKWVKEHTPAPSTPAPSTPS